MSLDEARTALDDAVAELQKPRRYANATEEVLGAMKLGMAYIQARDAFEAAVRVDELSGLLSDNRKRLNGEP